MVPTLRNAFQDYCIATSYGERSFWTRPSLQSFVVVEIARGITGNALAMVPQFYELIGLPSTLVHRVAGDDETLLRNVGWLAPVTGIAMSSFAAYKAYSMVSSSIAKGVICAVHAAAMRFFSVVPNITGFWVTVHSSLRGLILNPSRFRRFEETQLLRIQNQALKIENIAWLIVDIGCMWTLQNPILATMISMPAAAIVKLVAMRCLAEIQLYSARGEAQALA